MATKGKIVLILHLLCYLSFFGPSFSDTDTILQGHQFQDWDQLISANKSFKLQFFSPGTTNNRYLAIFYNKGPLMSFWKAAVWVANRDTSIPNASGNLMVDIDGNLKFSYISSGSHITIVLNSAPAKGNASVTLLDSGNLVMRELNSDGSPGQVLWQSFDCPTDTDKVPASGSFTLGGDPNGTSQLIIWWQGDVYWTSGLWHDGHFEFAPRLSHYDYPNFSYVSNEDEKYLTYLVTENDILTWYTMDSFGFVLERSVVAPFGACSLLEGPKTGCVKQKQPECRNQDNWFHEKRVSNGIDVPVSGGANDGIGIATSSHSDDYTVLQ
ncbi:hypothetical protein F0562_024662 [Nyssa sinensis]|uniref:Bulb-type lectin domain-containing protein n=1 Tax=Nyssa sinensis TaxID=561372 RepID=A0A5J5BCJ8_9ASTE|nr:hypothetical protein F0562_024662 [Nyssa sinensis]